MKGFTKSVETMTEWQQIAIGAALVSKMYPNYALFCELSGFASGARFNAILDLVWEYAGGVNSKIDFEKQLTKLEEITPDSEAYDMYGVWPAMDAATAMNSLLSACAKWDADEIQSLLILSRSTIASYLEFIDENERSDSIESLDNGYNHELYQEQDHYLEQITTQLSRESESLGRKESIKSLRLLCRKTEHSNIGMSL
ncbi:MAG: hypothetical protein ACI92E_002201 [Oceanicoccus sp.]|jgi:uncharacterized protein YjaG (DUF416 family)